MTAETPEGRDSEAVATFADAERQRAHSPEARDAGIEWRKGYRSVGGRTVEVDEAVIDRDTLGHQAQAMLGLLLHGYSVADAVKALGIQAPARDGEADAEARS